jgi:hypothetical protein
MPRTPIPGLLLALAATALACTHVYVQPVRGGPQALADVCIERNPKVRVSDFVQVLVKGFRRHGIETRVVQPPADPECDYVVHYSARRSWDLVTYMNYAEISVKQDDALIASATYSHSGGFAFNKYRGTRAKMDPVIDELLSDRAIPSE